MRLILADCDGCLLNWNTAFSNWMSAQGHILKNPNEYDISARYELPPGHGDLLVRQFNDVEKDIGTLPAWGDSVPFVRKLHFVHGFRFGIISAVSETRHTQFLRRENLYRVFGPECFEYVTCLRIGSKKDDCLRPYRDSGLFWIEDNLTNAMTGHEMGLKTLLIDAAYNGDSKPLPFPRVKNWAEIYEKIVG